ncbi:MAG: hypothetical protein JNJ64_00920, partial [Flavobacteriales bacterium]|nr:hypothetical protein [Flavobacteriales bacterium]
MNVIARSLLCLAMGGTLVCRAQQPGMLDTTFAGQGKLLLPGFGPVVDLELDSMGRILALTSSGSNSILIRLTASGQLDSTFGSFGSVICPNAPRRVLIQTDARILLLGNQVGTQGIVQRLEVDGGIDSTYGTAGQVVLPHGTFIRDGDLLADDKLMVTGDSTYVFNTDRAFLLKILSNGQADGSFAANGWLVIGGVASACYQQHWHGCEVRHADGDEFVWVRSTARHTCYPGGAYPRVFYSLHQADGGTLSGYDTGVNNVDASVYHHSLSVDPARGFHSVFGWNGDAQFRFSMFTGFTATLNYSPCPSSVATYGGIGRTCHDQFAHFIVPTNDNKFEVIRTLPDTIMGDCSWGIQGSVITDFVPSGYGGALVATPQVDGKLLVGGYAGWVGSHTFVIARYHNIPDPRAKLDLRLFLGGSWDPNTVLMHDSLRVQGLLPVQQPYLDSTFVSVNGVGAGMTSASVLDESGAGAAVDWVWLELLDAADTSTVVATRAGL